MNEFEYLASFYEIIVRKYFVEVVEALKRRNKFLEPYLSNEELMEIWRRTY